MGGCWGGGGLGGRCDGLRGRERRGWGMSLCFCVVSACLDGAEGEKCEAINVECKNAVRLVGGR